ncbi:MAG: 16S rRNA (guanine(966)-N(2))-methyltransferase RsmD [Candidatus Alcyoniella australis]|nr:16S rRNA (guanine(966)-N(2))-methyltransferase RsmD [Candidatus Alcyoniella australis]
MRVIGGNCRGRRLVPVKGLKIRPTADRVREAIFDIAYGLAQGADVLDLYAGSGALGIEALSRGARRALFVELDPRNARLIERNLELCGLTQHSEVLINDVLQTLNSLDADPGYSLVLADPPYSLVDQLPLLEAIAGCKAIAPGATLFLERDASCAINGDPKGLSLLNIKRYGKTSIYVYSKPGDG